MKRVTGWLASWALYWMGHGISRLFLRFDCMAWTYPAYNSCMGKSIAVQDWGGGNGPWTPEDGCMPDE